MTCTRQTPRCSDARSYAADLRPCCRALIVDLVQYFDGVMKQIEAPWFADYGTLLGAVRNQGIIPHDKDADVGMFGSDWEKLLAYRPDIPWTKGKVSFRPNLTRVIDGYQWTVKLPRNPSDSGRYEFSGGHSIKIRASKTNHTNIDVFPWYWDQDRQVWYRKRYLSIDRFKGRDIPGEQLLILSEVEWEGMKIPAPADPAAMCELRYGKHWATPIRANNDGVRR